MQMSKETVTPEKAAKWLKLNHCNRPLRMKHAERLAGAMKAGVYKLNGDTIRFANASSNGAAGKGVQEVLIDGQHRLTACVMSNTPFESYVVHGLEPEAFDTIDQNLVRKIGDILARHGEKNYVHIASALNQLRQLLSGYGNKIDFRLRPDEAIGLLEKNRQLRDSVGFVRGQPQTTKLLGVGRASALHYLMGKKDKDLADLFFTSFDSGAGLTAGNPVFKLREFVIKATLSRTKRITPIGLTALTIKAWNLIRGKRTVRVLSWNSTEDFPEIE